MATNSDAVGDWQHPVTGIKIYLTSFENNDIRKNMIFQINITTRFLCVVVTLPSSCSLSSLYFGTSYQILNAQCWSLNVTFRSMRIFPVGSCIYFANAIIHQKILVSFQHAMVWHFISGEEDYQGRGLTRPSQWRHNGRDSVSNHQPHDCLLNRLFRRRPKKTSKVRVTGLCAENSPGASNAENVSIWWRHYAGKNSCENMISMICVVPATAAVIFFANTDELIWQKYVNDI